MRVLDVRFIDVGARGIRSLSESMTQLQPNVGGATIHTLLLRGCNLSEAGGGNLGSALPGMSSLTVLDVGSCSLDPIGCRVCSFFDCFLLNLSCGNSVFCRV